jgi:beta-xylosidase
MMIGPVTAGGSTTLTLPLFKSDDLVNWTPFGNVTATVTTPVGKNFYRVDMSTNAPNP